ncbi:LysR family transcriptional regulator [Streptomyces rimosus]|uniref:LysR family transcriptional regulator n=1 Tax=Streptomyces rimosus TaxID=1927 RepID=UPI0009982E9B|nr:LysR family transcriptional regulator [Streptomyces rimosus]
MRDLHRLRVLVEIADRGSMSAAARALSFSQPAVSRQIEALEQEVGAQLVLRLGRGVRLTDAGLLLADRARGILSQIVSVKQELRSLNGLRGGRLRIGGFAGVNTYLLPRALARFAERYPRVGLSLSGSTTRHHVADLRSGLIDMALVTDWDLVGERAGAGLSGQAGGLDILPLFEEELFVAAGRDSPAGRGELSPRGLRGLAEESWIEGAHPDCLGPQPEFEAALGFEPHIRFRVGDWNAVSRLVEMAAGVTLVPGLLAARSGERFDVRSLAGHFPPRRVYVAFPKGAHSPAVEPMVEILSDVAREERELLLRTPVH